MIILFDRELGQGKVIVILLRVQDADEFTRSLIILSIGTWPDIADRWIKGRAFVGPIPCRQIVRLGERRILHCLVRSFLHISVFGERLWVRDPRLISSGFVVQNRSSRP